MTKHLLLPLFKKVDMVEQDKTFVDQAPTFLVNTFCCHYSVCHSSSMVVSDGSLFD